MTAPTRTRAVRASPSSRAPPCAPGGRDTFSGPPIAGWLPPDPAWSSRSPSLFSPPLKLMARSFVPAQVSRLLIRGATIVDARGERSGDVLVRGGRIVEVGDVHSATDEPVLAANGRYLTPGLIDCQ